MFHVKHSALPAGHHQQYIDIARRNPRDTASLGNGFLVNPGKLLASLSREGKNRGIVELAFDTNILEPANLIRYHLFAFNVTAIFHEDFSRLDYFRSPG